MFTKEYIKKLKTTNNGHIDYLITEQKDARSINFILENLGQLPHNFDATILYKLLLHSNTQVRLNAVKNIGKLNAQCNTDILITFFNKEKDTTVRREIISSIGRQRKLENKYFLFDVLNDIDPKIVCQAIRALLVFKGDKEIDNKLQTLINHENETVRTVIYKEYFAQEKKLNDILPHAQTYN
ncbi:MAG: HEAT repeat domain-containing protein [Chitinophagaceae bacterium]